MTFTIANLTIGFDEQGNFVTKGPDVLLSYDACIAWARIARKQQALAKRCMKKRQAVWSGTPTEEEKAEVLELEFDASMQAVVAAVTCIDALYDQVVRYAPINDKTRDQWKKNRTARHKQVAETLRATFRINSEDMKKLRTLLHAMYSLRDAAVHPSSLPQPAHLHPELPIATDWRLTAFRGDVADIFVCSALSILWDLTRGKRFRSDELGKFMEQLTAKVSKMLPKGKPKPTKSAVNFNIPRRPAARRTSART